MSEAIALIESRRFPLERMHTHSYPLAEIAKAIDVLAGDVPGEQAIHVAMINPEGPRP